MKLADVKMSLKDKKTQRRIIVCSVLIVVIIALAVLMFFIGKSFEIHLFIKDTIAVFYNPPFQYAV